MDVTSAFIVIDTLSTSLWNSGFDESPPTADAESLQVWQNEHTCDNI